MIVLGIETSCDETGVAVLAFRAGRARLLANLIASQDEIHTPYGGIVPELASRRHIEILPPMVEQALQGARVGLEDLDGVAVTNRPGLVGSLLVGLSFAKSLAFGLGIPFIGVSHLEGHLNAPLLESPKIPYPHIGLIVSGGHSALYLVKKFGDYRYLGGTRDDAAGEAFDKVAKLLGLGYPGGPAIDRMARQGNRLAVKLPKPHMPRYDFSFSGLKTAVKSVVEGRGLRRADRGSSHSPALQQPFDDRRDESAGGQTPALEADEPPVPTGGEERTTALDDLCASFQERAVDHLIDKTLNAARSFRCKAVVLTGGVACNSRLKEKLGEACRKTGRKLHFPSAKFCTDNAAMIAYVGGRHLLARKTSPLSLNAFANSNLKSLVSPPPPLKVRGGGRVGVL